MTTEEYLKQYIGQLVMQMAVLQATVDQLREKPATSDVKPNGG